MTTFLCSMPFLIYNLGVEMVYILVQRLKAQNITPDKSMKVIYDVVGSLFDRNFLHEMKRKQELHKHSAVRLLFEKLAHSSIMRLNSSSMSKLFDLMLMAFKYQLLRMKFPEELYQITLNHLNSLVEIMSKFEGAATCELLQSVKNEIIYLNNTYSKLNCFDYITLKQNLFRFFQGRNVKVSLFIQENLQSNNGLIYLPMNETCPPGTIRPGQCYVFNIDGTVLKEQLICIKLSSAIIKISTERMLVSTTDLGSNLYIKEKKTKEIKDSQEYSNINQSLNQKPFESSYKPKPVEEVGSSYIKDVNRKINVEAVKKEFKALADLINVDNSNDKKQFKIDLFPESNNKNRSSFAEDDCINIDRLENNNIKKIKDFYDDILDEAVEDNNEDDLLDLMDLAVLKK